VCDDAGMRDRNRSGPDPDELLPLAEAAQRLGIAYDTARKRLKAGTLEGSRRGGRWYVRLPRSGPDSGPRKAHSEPIPDALVAALQAEIAFLRQALDAEIEARRRADHLVAGLVERLPALAEAATSQDASVSENLASRSDETREMDSDLSLPRWRRFWHRIVGG
jgi:hypothetical protein